MQLRTAAPVLALLAAAWPAHGEPSSADDPAAPQPAVEPDDDDAPRVATSDAHDVVPERYVATIGEYGDVRTNLSQWAVGPPGWDVGGEMVFITSPVGLGAGPLAMTDVGLVRARARYTATRRIELFGSVDVLAKQPGYLEEDVVQGGLFGFKAAVTRTFALATAVGGGPTLGGDGLWGSGGTALVYRSHPGDTLSFEAHGGALATALRRDDVDNGWLTEATAGGKIMIHTPNGWFGAWLGADLAVPVVSSADLDPGTRLDVTIGTAYAVVRSWDVYITASIRDRGDASMPASMLPILDGGFDQRQIVVGVVRRFDGSDGRDDDDDRDAMLLLGR